MSTTATTAPAVQDIDHDDLCDLAIAAGVLRDNDQEVR